MKALSIKELEEVKVQLDPKSKDYWRKMESLTNRTLYQAYVNSQKAENNSIDFDDIIWADDVKPIAEILTRLGVQEFTISVRAGSLLDILSEFEELGFRIKGMTKVNISYDKTRQIPALLLVRE